MRLLAKTWIKLYRTETREIFQEASNAFVWPPQNKLISNTDLHKIDETRESLTVVGGDLSVNDRNFDRQTQSDYNISNHIQYVTNEEACLQ